jgi:class 3 adenylate cyclase/tetratricopeptide (TPR) repeat protein
VTGEENRPDWASFLPDYAVAEAAAHALDERIGRGWRFHAVVLFADVAGFTPMSEALGRIGKRGTEELTAILNSYFEPTIELIHSFGGTVAKFGGDAMTVVFPYQPSRPKAAARRALQCALDMQAEMGRYAQIETLAGRFALTVKAGLAAGPVLSATVGDTDIQVEHILAGAVLELAADAEHHSSAGEVVAHRDVTAALGDGVAIGERREDFDQIVDLAPRARRVTRTGERGGADRSAWVADAVAHYLHPSLVERLEAGQGGLIDEHRKVSVVFGRFEGIDFDDDPEAPAKLQRYVSVVITLLERYGGHLRQIDMGDKGSKFIAVFGAPIAHEDDEERAVRFAIDFNGSVEPAAAIGVNTGRAFCGFVGASTRREYAVMGDAVNVAARLMQAAAPGQVLAGLSTRTAAGDGLAWRALEPLSVKGKTEPLAPFEPRPHEFRPLSGVHEPVYTTPLIGRRQELWLADGRVDRASAGKGQLLGVTGEAGIGKSRLVSEVVSRAEERGFAVHAGACQSYGATAPYLVWREIWRSLLGVDLSLPAPELLDRLERRLDLLDDSLPERAPLLGAVLNVPLPDNALTASLDPQMRAESLRDLLLTCLRREAEKAPLLILIEDAHWIDPPSRELLELIGRNIHDAPVVLAVVYRTAAGEQSPLVWAARRPNTTEIALSELEPDEVRELIALELAKLRKRAAAPPQPFVERVTSRAGGNPFYIEETIRFITESGVDAEDATALADLEMPESLQSLVMARIDALSEGQKSTLKVASVIGRLFKASWLWGSYPPLGLPERVKHNLDELSKVGLTPLDRQEPELEYIFKHATIQEVAYDSLAFSTREDLHERVGLHVESAYADRVDQNLDVLAFHFGRSRNLDKQRVYFLRAGDAAKATFANDAAIAHYRRLLPLLDRSDQSAVLLSLGEVHQLIGEWSEAESSYREALSAAEKASRSREQARSRAAIGNLLSYTESYDEATRWLEVAVAELDRLGEREELSRVLEHLSYTYFRKPDYEHALACSERQMQLADELGDNAAKSSAAETMGLIWWHRGDHERSLEQFHRALALAGEIDFKRGLIHANNDLAGLYADLGDLRRSVECLNDAFSVATEIGYQHAAAVIIDNVGELRRELGEYEQALACYARALRIARQLGDWTGIERFAGHIGLVCAAVGDTDEAERLFDRAVAVGRTLNDRWLLGFYLLNSAELAFAQGRYAEAEEILAEAHEIASEIEDRETELRARLLLTRLRVTLGSIGRDAAIAALLSLDAGRDERQRAEINYTIWLIDGSREASRRLAARQYGELYRLAPKLEYRSRYEELTGEVLAEPGALPPLADSVASEPVDLKVLVEQATSFSFEPQAPPVEAVR